jgi:hypothetical protein
MQEQGRDGLGIPINIIIARFNAKLMGTLLLPNIATAIAIYPSLFFQDMVGKSDEPLLLDRAFIYRAALQSSRALLASRALSQPATKLAAKWAARVWEQEYVVRRTLRNIDDPRLPDASSAPPPGT